MKEERTFVAISALIGTIIGAGFLGIPFVVMQSGFKIGLIHLVFIASIVALITLYLGEIALRTKTNHHLPGYAEKYLGKAGKNLMFFAVAFGVYSALLAYLIAEGESLSYILLGNTDYSLYMSLLFWIVLSLFSYFGIKSLKKGEPIGMTLVFILFFSICVYLANKVDTANLLYINLNNLFLPFGVILFAFLGFTAIPEIKMLLGEDKKPLKKVIILSYLIALLIYIYFTFFVLGYAGEGTPQLATIALGKPFVLLSTITIFTAYLSLTTSMTDILKLDFGKTKARAWLWAISVPIISLFIFNLLHKSEFIKVLGIGGAISGGLTAILIILMSKNAKLYGERKPEYSMPHFKILNWILILIFLFGALMEIKHFLV
ncbi:MAG: aromatic amino acid transport family protein [Nanoarchaeota archaeon]